jgi:flagellar basal-body rod protein FlgG
MPHFGLSVAKTGLEAQQVQAAVTAQNLANAGTDGYKEQRIDFRELMYQKIRQPGGTSNTGTELPSGLMLGTGVRVAGTSKDFKAGSPKFTGNPYDMAINGRGFFRVLMPDGTTAYTRDGKFHPDKDGILVDVEGRQLQSPVTIPVGTRSVTIGKDGTVGVMAAGATAITTVSTIQLADFINPAGLEPIGDNLYIETPASGTPVVANPGQTGMGDIEAQSLEASNVNVVEQLVSLIEGQRAYEMNAKAVETIDNEEQFVIQVL